ncbi:MAG: sulfate adenylyltransferase subunit CysN [Planctomycetota bacterium]|nr:MAG: sulfate adenylyltransferase subunit CysN [Planctomycetota bacterium]
MHDAALIDENIEEYLDRHERKELLRFVTVGSVDDGKSTLIGRLLRDTGGVYEDQLAAVAQASGRDAGADGIDLALITDGLKAEREQGITIDVAYRYFTTPARKFIIADTPGHVQYTRNMATGASTADVALILIDARHGVLSQSRRHAFIASLLGIPNLLVCVNKLDLVDFSENVYQRIVEDFHAFSQRLSFQEVRPIPISALTGDNVVSRSEHTGWYSGPTVLEYLESVPINRARNYNDLCFPIQLVQRPNLDFRGYSGTVTSGVVRPGDAVTVLPAGTTTTIKALHTFDGTIDEAFPPMAVTITLNDEVDASRGDVITHRQNPLTVSRHIEAHLVWMHQDAMEIGKQYLIKHATNQIPGTISRLHHRTDIHTLGEEQAERLELNEIGKVSLTLARPIVADRYQDNREAGAFVLIDRMTNLTVGCGMVTGFGDDEMLDSDTGARVVSPQERARRFGQKPATVWLTGLPGCGKTAIGHALERRLFDAGHLPYVLDRERVPRADLHGTGAKLAPVIEAARQGLDLGLVSIVAFTTPGQYDRQRAKEHLDRGDFLEIAVTADEGIRNQRLKEWKRSEEDTDVAYDTPTSPDLTIDTSDGLSLEPIVDRITSLLRERGILL